MGKDKRGTFRMQCTFCDCPEYELEEFGPSASALCIYCLHPPGAHSRVSSTVDAPVKHQVPAPLNQLPIMYHALGAQQKVDDSGRHCGNVTLGNIYTIQM